MSGSTLHYVYDPLCGWCYAAGPLIEAVAGAGIPIKLHGGGLWDTAQRIAPEKRAYIRQADARIAELAGVVFGTAYLDGLLADPSTTLWSRPTTAAVLAANAGLRMLKAIQHAHYVEGRHVVEREVLVDLAGKIGLDIDDFELALGTVETDEHIAASRRLMHRAGLSGFPGFLLERDGNLFRLEHEGFYGHPADFVRTITAPSA